MRPRFNSATPAVQYWKASDTGPTERERRILRRIATSGGLCLTRRNGGTSYAFADGTPVRDEFGRFDFTKFERLQWIEPDPGAPALFPDLAPAQRYLARWQP